ncbi:ABC transporter substrate-binding protein, partial [bacterium]|nr:ABC transporter substrate-binding protein [bacterium]
MIGDTTSSMLTSFVFDGLTRLDGQTLEIKPSLAESWTVDNSGKVWIINLKKDVYWSDGEKFTARDVLFTYNELIYNDKIPTSSRDVLTIDGKKIDVQQIDDYTVRFKLPAPFAPFLLELSHPILPFHKLKDKLDNGVFTHSWGIDSNLLDVVGAGPYTFYKYFPGERIVLKKNPLHKPEAKIDYIAVSIIPDTNSELLRFMRGDLDIVGISPQDYNYAVLDKSYGKVYNVINVGESALSNFLAFNLNKNNLDEKKYSWFSNKKFRKAIAYAIDKKTIIDNVFYGLGERQDSSITKANLIFHNKDTVKYEYNLDKTKALLREIGFEQDSKDGYFRDFKGNIIEFNLFTNSESKERVDICNIISDDFKKAGLKVNVVVLQFGLLLNKLMSSYDWDMVCLGFGGTLDPHAGKNVWESTGNLHLWNKGKDAVYSSWEKQIDQLFNSGAKELNSLKRKEIYDKWQYIASDELPLIYTVLPSTIYGINKRLKNVQPTVFG